jgi:predicted Zn-dependent protease
LALAFAVGFLSSFVFGSSVPPRKRSKADRDIAAIGYRRIACSDACIGNWYSIEQEKKIGGQLSASLEQSTPLLRDPITAAYLEGLAKTMAQNSDTQIPITVRVADSESIYALTLPGGYQYISRGLLLRLQSEGELASVLARGIAHTALRSATREYTRANLMKAMTIPVIFEGQPPISSTSDSGLTVPLMLLWFRRDEELDADYFGVQYLYKAGYDTNSFISFILTVWPASGISGKPASTVFSSFPPVAGRLKALEKEISDILPKRSGAATTTPEFIAFREHLLSLEPPKVEAKPQPTLLRPDLQPR